MDLEKYKKSYQEIEKLQQTKNLDYYRHPARYYVKPFKIVENLYYIILRKHKKFMKKSKKVLAPVWADEVS